ncbi:YheC/YheD family protein [Paenibacillus sp. Soil522]|uniref:YheC/YheD family protein n=1 Tax=Paenibacillus sp. Soil522 TaxID=1736388 RepID=UPI0006F9A88B|nr:YheC/YheD family protein [Paenibacillus sp. Soil522]KRE33942.1 hypothetical protein ASG81_23135 [Paenibacillus sp. Soil522]
MGNNATILKTGTTKDKWGKFKVLNGSKKLVPFLPATLRMTKQALWELIDKYGTVMLKPCVGHSGYGVIQVCKKKNDQLEIHAKYKKVTLDGKKQTFNALKKGIRNYKYFVQHRLKKGIRSYKYIVQRRIPLAEITNRPFDLRVMVQRKKHSEWKVTGMLAKVANEGYVITNVTNTILPAKKAIQQSSIKISSWQELLPKIHKISLQAAQRLGDFYPFQRTIGFDIGLDHKAKIWIIEANFAPSTRDFLLLKDKSIYRRIMSYKKG